MIILRYNVYKLLFFRDMFIIIFALNKPIFKKIIYLFIYIHASASTG